jgi:hypothetical protein
MLPTARLVIRPFALLLCAAMLLLPSRAQAQFGMGAGMGGFQQNAITKRGVEAYVKILGLDKDQREVALTLLEGNQTEYHAAQKKMEEAIKAVQEKVADTQDFSLFQKEMVKAGKEFGDKTKALEKSFFDDLKASCNESQLSKWPRVERYHRRENGMKIGFVSGAAVDLVQVVDRVKATPADALAPVLEQYELDMDKALVALEKTQKDAEEDFGKGDANMFDMTKVETVLKRFYEAGKEMRDSNREYARKLGQLMDAASKERFDAEFKRRSFPRVYKEAHVVKMLDAAAGLSDLDKDKKGAIADLLTSYKHDAAAANDKWAKAVEEREDKAGGTFMVMMKSAQAMQGGSGVGDLNKDVNDARTARKELDEKTKDRLLTMLSEEQKAKLPEAPPENGNPWADFMPVTDEGK